MKLYNYIDYSLKYLIFLAKKMTLLLLFTVYVILSGMNLKIGFKKVWAYML